MAVSLSFHGHNTLNTRFITSSATSHDRTARTTLTS